MTNVNNELTAAQGEVVVQAETVVPFDTKRFESNNVQVFSSITGDDRATRVKVYNAINSSENALGDHLGEAIEIQDMVAHPVELENEAGELVQAMRVVLLTPEGVGYHSVANGVVSSLEKIIGIVGQAPWNEPIVVVPNEVKTRKGYKTLNLHLQG